MFAYLPNAIKSINQAYSLPYFQLPSCSQERPVKRQPIRSVDVATEREAQGQGQVRHGWPEHGRPKGWLGWGGPRPVGRPHVDTQEQCPVSGCPTGLPTIQFFWIFTLKVSYKHNGVCPLFKSMIFYQKTHRKIELVSSPAVWQPWQKFVPSPSSASPSGSILKRAGSMPSLVLQVWPPKKVFASLHFPNFKF